MRAKDERREKNERTSATAYDLIRQKLDRQESEQGESSAREEHLIRQACVVTSGLL